MQDFRQVLGFLLLGAKRHDHRRQHQQAQRNQHGCARLVALLAEDVFLRRGPVGAAVFHRPLRHGPAFLYQYRLPLQGNVFFDEDTAVVGGALNDMRGQFFRQELAHLTLELQFCFAEVEIHGINLG